MDTIEKARTMLNLPGRCPKTGQRRREGGGMPEIQALSEGNASDTAHAHSLCKSEGWKKMAHGDKIIRGRRVKPTLNLSHIEGGWWDPPPVCSCHLFKALDRLGLSPRHVLG